MSKKWVYLFSEGDASMRDLLGGKSDLVLCGGVHLCHDPSFWSVFCQLGALSRGQQIRPFDRHADGLLIGEGVGIVVLKRLADAERDGDRVYAVIRGIGSSSDGRSKSVYAPLPEGQARAPGRRRRRPGVGRLQFFHRPLQRPLLLRVRHVEQGGVASLHLLWRHLLDAVTDQPAVAKGAANDP